MNTRLMDSRIDAGASTGPGLRKATPPWERNLAEVNRELWLILSLFVITGLLNWLLSSHGMIVGLYTLPTLFSAYVYGRRHAVLTAVASILLVALINIADPGLFVRSSTSLGKVDRWFDLGVWSSLLTVTAYAMGTLYERKEWHVRELRRTYFGVLMILQQFVSDDKYTHNHSYRVAFYASNIARQMGFDEERIDDVRAAALLHDIGKLETTREIICRAANVAPEEPVGAHEDTHQGVATLEPVEGPLRRVLSIVLVQHRPYNESASRAANEQQMPVEARVLAVADAYDTLTSDRPYRRAVTPFEAKEIIAAGSGTDFDPQVVEAFMAAFHARKLEIPEGLVT